MADANDRGDQCIYLLSYLKTSICDCLKNVEGLNHGRIGLCDLKFNKKLSSGDLIIPAFVRTCFRDHLNGEDNVDYQRLCQEIITCVSRIQFVKHCQVTGGGHLLLNLNKSLVTSSVIYNVMHKVDQFDKSSDKQSLIVLLNPSFLWSSLGEEQENLNLDQLRTILVCEHSKELLQVNGVFVKLMSTEPSNIHTSKKAICHIFAPSFTSVDAWTDIDLDRKVKELGKVLKNCKYSKQVESARSQTETANSSNQASVSKLHSCGYDNGECCFSNYVLSVEDFYKDINKQVSDVCNRSKVTLSSQLLKDLAKLDLVGKSTSADMLLHVASCQRMFIQQQVSTVWQMSSESPLSTNQLFLSHGLVTINKDGEKLQCPLDAMDLLRIREKQLRESYVLKYGNRVEGHDWETSIRQIAVAAVKLEILSVAPNRQVKINLSESSREFRQATFVMYNCARLAKLFENFEENVQKGLYPALPPVTEVDFNLLRDETEWELTLNFILAFPSVVKDTVPAITSKSQSITIHTNKICCLLFTLSHKFSSYYGRVHILGEPRHHLFPVMFARLYLMKALQQIFLTCLKLLNVTSLNQM